MDLASIPADTLIHVWNAVRLFDDFNRDNDPHGEHDCAILDVKGAPEQVMFKTTFLGSHSKNILSVFDGRPNAAHVVNKEVLG